MSENISLPVVNNESGFSRYLFKINNIPSLTKEEEFLLAKNYIEYNDLKAAHKLVTSHLKLVAKIAIRYKNYGLPITELVSEGNIGLMQAVKKFDPHLGYRLSTYAMWWIKAAIQEYVLKSWSLVKIGTTSAQKKLFFSLGKIKNKIMNLYGRPINDEDNVKIASDLGISVKEVNEMNQRLNNGDISLNQTSNSLDEGEGKELIELIAEDSPSHENILMDNQVLNNQKKLLCEAMKNLNDREADILSARKLSYSPDTLDTLSNKYSISKERVRQIENRAFEKIKEYILDKISTDGQIKATC